MGRRTGRAAILLLACASSSVADQANDADVLVLGGTPSGVAAAVAAARMGSSVVLVEPTGHVGGIVSNGLTNADIINRQAVAGLFYEFTQRVLEHYRTTYGPDSSQVKLCRNGYYFEPHVAENVFLEMIREEMRAVGCVKRTNSSPTA